MDADLLKHRNFYNDQYRKNLKIRKELKNKLVQFGTPQNSFSKNNLKELNDLRKKLEKNLEEEKEISNIIREITKHLI